MNRWDLCYAVCAIAEIVRETVCVSVCVCVGRTIGLRFLSLSFLSLFAVNFEAISLQREIDRLWL